MAQYKVAKGHSILLPSKSKRPEGVNMDTEFLKEGDLIPDDILTKQEIENKLKDKSIVPVQVQESSEPDTPDIAPTPHTQGQGDVTPGTAQTTGAVTETVARSGSGTEQEQEEQPEEGKSGEITETVTREPEPDQSEIQTVDSPWMFNPSELEGKSLDELRIMAIEAHPDADNFDPEEELPNEQAAIQYLSQDFEE